MHTAWLIRHDAVRRGALALALAALALTPALTPAAAQSRPDTSSTPPKPDPRVGLRAGWMDAAQAQWNMRLVSTTAPSAQFRDTTNPNNFNFINSDIAFDGHYVVQGNFSGFQVWDIAQATHPTLVTAYVCPGSQNDVSVYRNLLFMSVEALSGRVDCGGQGVQDTVSAERMRGIRIFDLSDIAHPKPIVNVQTCRGSHTHTLVTSPADTANVYIYVSGTAPVRSPNELAGCSGLRPDQDPNSELFRIEVIQVPLAHPEQAHVITKPAILAGLVHPESHPEAAEDITAAKRVADSARATGAFTATLFGLERVLPPGLVNPLLDSIVKARSGTGAPTAADSAALRGAIQGILDARFNPPPPPGGVRPGPVQCHDITVYPALGLAGGACAGYGVLLDIRDPANPRRIAAVADSNFAFWHSATFNNAGTQILFTDEWGGGLQPKCRPTDDPKWGADALFTVKDSTLTFQSYYKLPAPQTAQENCVAHNGSLVPVPGRDIMVQGWYQGGISVFDWTDPAHPREIAFFDRGPMDSTKLEGAGSWSAYWYNGYIVSSEIGRGLDVLELLPNGLLTRNEIDAAKLVHFDQVNVQDQQRLVWPASFAVARAYLDQLARGNGLGAARVSAVRSTLARAEQARGQQRRAQLTQLAAALDRDAGRAADQTRVRALATAVRSLAAARP
ncbi:MAG: LVIVD repeat-containing protein [Gemmatimonadota bacterium]